MQLYQWLATTVEHNANCVKANNQRWQDITESRIESAIRNLMPSGSGFDCDTKFDLGANRGKPYLRFATEFHHMNGVGYYDGWTQHVITVKPCLAHGFTMSISGRNRDQIKDYIYEVFDSTLRQEVVESWADDKSPESYTIRLVEGP